MPPRRRGGGRTAMMPTHTALLASVRRLLLFSAAEEEEAAEEDEQGQFPKRWTIVFLCFSAFLLCNMDRVEDLGNLMKLYTDWHSHPISYCSFQQFMRKVEKLGAGNHVRVEDLGNLIKFYMDCHSRLIRL